MQTHVVCLHIRIWRLHPQARRELSRTRPVQCPDDILKLYRRPISRMRSRSTTNLIINITEVGKKEKLFFLVELIAKPF